MLYAVHEVAVKLHCSFTTLRHRKAAIQEKKSDHINRNNRRYFDVGFLVI